MNDNCDICDSPTDDGYIHWAGPPFGKTRRVKRCLCVCCLAVMKASTIPITEEIDVAIVGTYSGDIQTLNEMMDDGFDKKEATKSIRAMGTALEIDKATIQDRLKK